jgi:CHAD domain-containing protein
VLDRVEIASYGAMEEGLRRTYRSARHRFRELDDEHDDVTLHELRKRIKDLRFQLDLLGPAAPGIFAAQSRIAQDASELLGRDHDLVTLTEELALLELGHENRRIIERLIATQRTELQTRALELCAELLREKPQRRTQRLLSYLPPRSQAST